MAIYSYKEYLRRGDSWPTLEQAKEEVVNTTHDLNEKGFFGGDRAFNCFYIVREVGNVLSVVTGGIVQVQVQQTVSIVWN